MFGDGSFPDLVASQLPDELKIRCYHISSPPAPTSALFAPAPGQAEDRTFCESHFLVVALPATAEHAELFLFATEVLIFTTSSLTTIFVSKADTSGLRRDVPSCTALVVTSFLKRLISQRVLESKVVLSLFARSQGQYLFPGSIENAGKHVLDDRQLIKWWCKVLDPIVRQVGTSTDSEKSPQVQAHLIVPGCDRAETRAFFPPNARHDTDAKWINLYPVDLMVRDQSQPLRCLIPRLPDDPKSRFLVELDKEYISPEGQWRSVRSMERFWEMMSYRQECSAGRLVGFIWIVFWRDESTAGNLEALKRTDAEQVEVTGQDMNSTDLRVAVPVEQDNVRNGNSTMDVKSIEELRLDPLAEGKSQDPIASAYYDDARTQPVRCPEPGRKQIVLSDDQYEALVDHMLELDFAGLNEASKSTKSWMSKLVSFLDNEQPGIDIVGRKSSSSTTGASPKTAETAPAQVNILTGIRKKRKASNAEILSQASTNGPPIKTLSAGLVRKKPKP